MTELGKNCPTTTKIEPCDFMVVAVQFVDQILEKAMHAITFNLSEASSDDLDFCYLKDQALIPSPESGCNVTGAGLQQRLSESDIQKAFLDKMNWKCDDQECLPATRGQGDAYNAGSHTDIATNIAKVLIPENDENPPPQINEATLEKKGGNNPEADLETVNMQCIDWEIGDKNAVYNRKDHDERNMKGFQRQAQGDTPFAPLNRLERDFIEAKVISRVERDEIEEKREKFLRTIEQSKYSPRPLQRKFELAARSGDKQSDIQFTGHPYEEEVYLTLNNQHDRYYDTTEDHQETVEAESDSSIHLEEVTLTHSASQALDCRASKCELETVADLKVIQSQAKDTSNRIADELKSPEKVKGVGTTLGRAWRAICRVFGGQHQRSSSSPPKRKPSAPYRKTPSPKRKMYSMSDLESPGFEGDNQRLNRYTILEPHFSNSVTPEMANLSLPERHVPMSEDLSKTSGLRRLNSERKWGTCCSKNCKSGDHNRQRVADVGRPLHKKSASMGSNCTMS